MLSSWDSFYVIIGSAAGALIGLQFVVLTLIADRPSSPGADAGAAFATPTIVHFCAVLLLAAVLRAPWGSVAAASIASGLIGGSGVVYAVIVSRRIRRQKAYRPELEDWLFHVVFPIIAYGILGVSPLALLFEARVALFAVGGSALMLLFVAIHNAWDAVSYHVFVTRHQDREHHRDTSSR